MWLVAFLIATSLVEFSRTCVKDAWDGYRANRNRILDHIQDNRIDNTLILSGDSHANWVSDLVRKLTELSFYAPRHLQWYEDPNDTTYDPASGKGSLAVEFAGVRTHTRISI